MLLQIGLRNNISVYRSTLRRSTRRNWQGIICSAMSPGPSIPLKQSRCLIEFWYQNENPQVPSIRQAAEPVVGPAGLPSLGGARRKRDARATCRVKGGSVGCLAGRGCFPNNNPSLASRELHQTIRLLPEQRNGSQPSSRPSQFRTALEY